MRCRLLAVLLLLLTIPIRAVPAAPLPKGDRTLGMSVAAAQNGDYSYALSLARAAGAQSVTLSLDWSRLEPAPGRIDVSLITLADSYYPPRGVPVDLILRPINTNRLEYPADLRAGPLDSPEAVRRFERLLDQVFAAAPHLALHSLVIGNEVDDYLGGDAGRWRQWGSFYDTVAAYARGKRPGLKIGVAATWSGLVGAASARLRALNRGSDLIAATYYPLTSRFDVRSPESPAADFDALCKLYPGRLIELTECGYPSSAACGSSEAAQAQFVRSMFAAWDRHAAQMTSITMSWETDVSPNAAAADSRYYGVGGAAFLGFLGSLGLRTYPGAGSDKPAFAALAREAHMRGW